MNKTKLGVLFVVSLLAISGIAMAQGASAPDTGARYYVKSNNGILKAVFGVQHNFEKGFTTDLAPGQQKALEKLGVETEKVGIYHILGKPICGDAICQGNEPRTCPQDCVATCGNDIIEAGEECEIGYPCLEEGYECIDCKCIKESTRLCTPQKQIPWGIAKVNGGSGGAGVKVAVLDTGVYSDHLDLKANILDCKDTTKRGIKDGCADRDGHGTHVAGTIAANGGSDYKGIYGVAPQAELMVIKVCGPTGCWTDDIAEAIGYVTDQGANIISMSLGGNIECPLMKEAIQYAVDNSVLVVAAAGNDGSADGSIDYPAANVNVIAVGAIDVYEEVPDFSSRGVNDGDYIVEEREVEFGAPGVSVESTYKNGCYAYSGGTSMATPHVAGLAAKLWQDNAVDTRKYLHSIAKDIWITEDNQATPEDERDDTATGFGLPIAP